MVEFIKKSFFVLIYKFQFHLGIHALIIEYAHVHELLHAMQKNLHRAIQQNAEFIANN